MYKRLNHSRSVLVDAAVYNNLKTELYHSFSDEDISVLKHHGILGMKWGVRRYQNEDGTLTPEGERRYYKDEKGKYRKRNKEELAKYDREMLYKQKVEDELNNNKPAEDVTDFYERMETRWYSDPKVRDMCNKWYDLTDEIDVINNEDAWDLSTSDGIDRYDKALKELPKLEKEYDKVHSDLVKYFDRFKSSDMDSVEGWIDDMADNDRW